VASRSSKLVLIGCAVAASLVAAACSSDKGGGNGGSTSADTSTGASAAASGGGGGGAKPTGSPIKIGVLAGLSGALAPQYGGNGKIVQAWASKVNAAGGISGHPIKVISVDSKADAASYQAGARQLVENDKVVAIISADDYAEAAGGPYLGKSGVPVVGSDGTNSTTWGALPNYYQVNTSYPYSSSGEVIAAKAAGAKSVASIVCAEVANCLSTGKFQKDTAEKIGLRYDGVLTAAGSAASYQAQCVQITSKKTDFIALSIPAPTAAKLVPQCAQQGFTGTVGFNTEGYVYKETTGIGAQTVVADLQGFPWWIDAAPVKEFRDTMAKYASSVDYRSGNATNTWMSVKLIQKGLELAGVTSAAVTPAILTAGLSKVSNETLGGLLSSPVTYTAGKPAAPNRCFWPIQWKKGTKDPSVLHIGTSGNGATGDLASSCDTVSK
jgi:branched-chain amino acid transport system substrate-binding protein